MAASKTSAKKAAAKKPSRKKAVAKRPAARKPAPKSAGAPVNGTAEVDAYMQKLKHPRKAELEAVRAIILNADRKISERVKWNAPSFFYIQDLAAFNWRSTKFAHLILLFPDGKGMSDSPGLLEGTHANRREAKFHDMADVQAKKPALEKLVKAWVKRMGAAM